MLAFSDFSDLEVKLMILNGSSDGMRSTCEGTMPSTVDLFKVT